MHRSLRMTPLLIPVCLITFSRSESENLFCNTFITQTSAGMDADERHCCLVVLLISQMHWPLLSAMFAPSYCVSRIITSRRCVTRSPRARSSSKHCARARVWPRRRTFAFAGFLIHRCWLSWDECCFRYGVCFFWFSCCCCCRDNLRLLKLFSRPLPGW